MSIYKNISQGVIEGDLELVREEVQKLIDNGTDPISIINEGLMAGMNIVGVEFKNGDMFVPEVMMSARAMSEGIGMVKPLINEADMPTMGTVLIGTVKGDLHDIGKNLVGMMMESSGFKVIDLGVDITAEKFVEAVREHQPDILGMSAMLTTTMDQMKETVNALIENGLRENIKIIIGGAPVTKRFAEEINADGYSVDASEAAELCKRLAAS